MKNVFLFTLFTASFLFSCNSISKDDYEKLQEENLALRAEIDEIKNGPERLLNEAKASIDRSDMVSSKANLEKIISKHSSSKEYKEAQKLLVKVNQSIKDENDLKEKQAAEKAKIEKERLANAVKKLRTSVDDMKGITWYYDKSTPKNNDVNSFHIYMGKKGSGIPWLRFSIQYKSDDWLFIEKYLIKTDNNSYTIYADRDVERDNGYGGIWEWYDTQMTQELYDIIKDIIDSKNVRLRSEGKQYYKDRQITAKEKQGLKNVLDAYESLGGTLNFN